MQKERRKDKKYQDMTAAEFASLSELPLTLSPNTFRDVPVATSMAWKEVD